MWSAGWTTLVRGWLTKLTAISADGPGRKAPHRASRFVSASSRPETEFQIRSPRVLKAARRFPSDENVTG